MGYMMNNMRGWNIAGYTHVKRRYSTTPSGMFYEGVDFSLVGTTTTISFKFDESLDALRGLGGVDLKLVGATTTAYSEWDGSAGQQNFECTVQMGASEVISGAGTTATGYLLRNLKTSTSLNLTSTYGYVRRDIIVEYTNSTGNTVPLHISGWTTAA